MATYTSNYQLHQWVPEDDFLRTDFNTDFQKIDAALAGLDTQISLKCRIYRGNYIGNGTTPHLIAMPSTPEAVILSLDTYTVSAIHDGKTQGYITIINNGFRLESGSEAANQTGKTYTYIAFLEG